MSLKSQITLANSKNKVKTYWRLAYEEKPVCGYRCLLNTKQNDKLNDFWEVWNQGQSRAKSTGNSAAQP